MCKGFLMGSEVHSPDLLLFLNFVARSSEMLDLFGRWHFQANGQAKLGLKYHMSSKSQFFF